MFTRSMEKLKGKILVKSSILGINAKLLSKQALSALKELIRTLSTNFQINIRLNDFKEIFQARKNYIKQTLNGFKITKSMCIMLYD